jgi:hypothetical protein
MDTMNLELFTRYLDTFGADFRRWPETERAAAEALCDSSPEARRRWEAARRLDALFALDRDSTTDAAAQSAIIDAALRRVRGLRTRGFDWSWLFVRPMRAAMAAALAVGVLAGALAGPEIQASDYQGELALTLLLGDGASYFMEPL